MVDFEKFTMEGKFYELLGKEFVNQLRNLFKVEFKHDVRLTMNIKLSDDEKTRILIIYDKQFNGVYICCFGGSTIVNSPGYIQDKSFNDSGEAVKWIKSCIKLLGFKID